jgi:scyllo-inositol 2-dehydrogenase (NADP+)
LFGRVINVESRLGQFASCVGPAAREYRPGWRNEAAYGGGGLFDWGSHFVDQVWRLMRPARPVRVFAQLRGNVWTHDCDDFARVCIDFDNGAVGLVEINTTTTRPLPRWHIDGTAGSADSPFSLSFDTGEWARLDFAPADGSAVRRVTPPSPGLTESAIWGRFADAVRGKGEPAVSADSVLPTMALLDAARESSRTGQAVDISREG